MRSAPLRLLVVLALALAPAVRADDKVPEKAHNFAQWENEIAAFEKADVQTPPAKGGIVFVGSSSIRLWKTFAQDFPQQRVLNRGFGGSEIADSVHFADRVVLPYAPRMVVLYAGGNDLNNGRPPAEVFADFKAFAEKVRAALPAVGLAYISSVGNPARWAQVEKVRALNGLIAAYLREQPGMQFIDVFSRMLGDDGLPRPELFGPDKLHMSPEGYKLWAEIIGPLLPAAPSGAGGD